MDAFLSPPTQHEHAPHPDRIHVTELYKHVKARAATSDESSSSILFLCLANVSSERSWRTSKKRHHPTDSVVNVQLHQQHLIAVSLIT